MVRVSRLPQGNETESEEDSKWPALSHTHTHTYIHLLTILKGNTASKRRAGVNPSLSGFMVCDLSIKSRPHREVSVHKRPWDGVEQARWGRVCPRQSVELENGQEGACAAGTSLASQTRLRTRKLAFVVFLGWEMTGTYLVGTKPQASLCRCNSDCHSQLPPTLGLWGFNPHA